MKQKKMSFNNSLRRSFVNGKWKADIARNLKTDVKHDADEEQKLQNRYQKKRQAELRPDFSLQSVSVE